VFRQATQVFAQRNPWDRAHRIPAQLLQQVERPNAATLVLVEAEQEREATGALVQPEQSAQLLPARVRPQQREVVQWE